MNKTQRPKLIAIIFFQTRYDDGQTAETQIPAKPDALNSRQTRKDAEILARLAFKELNPARYRDGQPIKAIDIQVYQITENPPPAVLPGANN